MKNSLGKTTGSGRQSGLIYLVRSGAIWVVLTLLGGMSAMAQINPAGSLTNWIPILYGPSVFPDAFSDQQTGSDESDLVGTSTRASFFTSFWNGGTPNSLADGQLGFRLRLAGEKNPTGFSTAALVGMDVTADGVIDLFVGVNNSGSADSINIWRPDPGSSNNSPATADLITTPLFTWAESGTNYNWTATSAANDPGQTLFDLDGNGSTDYFLTFTVPFASVVSAFNTVGITNVTEVSAVSYLAITATQENSFNQDINGITNGISSSTTFIALGALSQPNSVNPISGSGPLAVPEPSTSAMIGLACLGAMGVIGLRRRQHH